MTEVVPVVPKTRADQFPILWTIRVGTYKTGPDMLVALRERNVKVSDCLVEALQANRFPLEPKPRWVPLVLTTPKEIGLAYWGVYRPAIYKRAKELGLGLCSPEAAFQIFLQDTPTPKFGRASLAGLVETSRVPAFVRKWWKFGFGKRSHPEQIYGCCLSIIEWYGWQSEVEATACDPGYKDHAELLFDAPNIL